MQRASVAAICEPRLLRDAVSAASAIEICRRCTQHLLEIPREHRASPAARTLRQALGYGWSVAVAVAADPAPGLLAFRALATDDADVAWTVKENLRKKRPATLL